MRRLCGTLGLLAVCLLSVPSLHAQTGTAPRRPMTFDDLMKMRRVGDLDLSPDGRWVLFSVVDVDLARNTRTPHLWIAPTTGHSPTTDTGDALPLTASMAGESRGRFSPDGKQILFLSPRSGAQQIWLVDFDTNTGTIGNPHQLTTLSTEADAARWSPDGSHIAFLSFVYPDCPADATQDACDQKRDQAEANSPVKARIFTHLLYRHWNHFTGDKRSHIFLIAADGTGLRDLNPGDAHDVPPFSLGGPDAFAFSPDSKEIAFEENIDPDPATSTNSDIFTLQLDDPHAKPTKVSTSPGADASPAYSPDGKYLAWRSQARAGYESDRWRLAVYDRGSHKITEPLPDFDRWIDEFTWGADSKTIYFVSGSHGEAPIFSLSLDAPASSLAVISDKGEYGDLHASADGKILVAERQTVRRPTEIYKLMLDQPRYAAADEKNGRLREAAVAERPLTHLNDETLASLDLPEMEPFWFSSVGRIRVEGFVLKPPGFDPTRKYPVKFLIHGGPEGAWGDSWSYRWNAELFAANGYIVIMVNPRGSTGYGQAFVDGVNGDWGGKPYLDLMRGLDYAEAHFPFVDKTRECALGASYGGYMADWILGHTDRFKCIVTHDGMFDTVSAFGDTDELWFAEWEFKGTPWTNQIGYRRWSPMLSADHFKTPTLVVHGQLDYRLDVSQGFQLFDTLQLLHVPSKMLYFPDEGHWVLKPQNSQLWYKTVNDWVDQWTK